MRNYFNMGITFDTAMGRLAPAVITSTGEVVGVRPYADDEDYAAMRQVAVSLNALPGSGNIYCPECGASFGPAGGRHVGDCRHKTKIRRRVEDALRKTATETEVMKIASLLGVKIE